MAMTVILCCSNKMCGIKGTAAADMVKQNTSCNKNWGSEIIITCDAMQKIFLSQSAAVVAESRITLFIHCNAGCKSDINPPAALFILAKLLLKFHHCVCLKL